MNENSFQISNKTKGRLPSLPFVEIKEKVLGQEYELSLVFCGEKRSKKLNQIYREKDKVANVLSFPINEKTGEIFITPAKAKKEAIKFEMNYENFLTYLFIHGVLHLKGMDHGDEMEKEEEKLKKEFLKN